MKAKNFLIVGVLSLTVLMATSCVHDVKTLSSFDSGPQMFEKRLMSGFEKIEIAGSPTVYYSQADSFSVIVKGAEKLLEEIITTKNGNTLEIRNRGKVGIFNVSVRNSEDLAVYVTSPDLVGVNLSGSGDFISEKRIDSDKFDVTLRGSGDIRIQDLICDNCNAEVIGSGDMVIKRLESKDVSALLVGSGDLSLDVFQVDNTSLVVRGSGDMNVNFREGCRAADCSLTGSGDINLKGKVKHFTSKKHGSGDIDTAKLSIEK